MDTHLYLAHHGIKGQKWGVRRFQNPDGSLTARGHQRYLNDLDYEMRSYVSSGHNARVTRQHYERKARLAKHKGNTDKASKYSQRAKDAGELERKEFEAYQAKGKEYLEAISSLQKSGYAFKVTPVNYMSVKRTSAGKEYMDKHGLYSRIIDSNVASGNRYKVRKHVSAKKNEKWKAQSRLQSHRAQRMEVYYV